MNEASIALLPVLDLSSNTHRRRISSTINRPDSETLTTYQVAGSGVTTPSPANRGRVEHLPSIQDTPPRMPSLSRSPSPQPNGGWHTPGLTDGSPRKAGAGKSYGGLNGTPAWSAAQARSSQVNAYSSPSKGGFIKRHLRQISASLPQFYPPNARDYSDREKLGRGRWKTTLRELSALLWRMARRLRVLLSILLAVTMGLLLFYNTCKSTWSGMANTC